MHGLSDSMAWLSRIMLCHGSFHMTKIMPALTRSVEHLSIKKRVSKIFYDLWKFVMLHRSWRGFQDTKLRKLMLTKKCNLKFRQFHWKEVQKAHERSYMFRLQMLQIFDSGKIRRNIFQHVWTKNTMTLWFVLLAERRNTWPKTQQKDSTKTLCLTARQLRKTKITSFKVFHSFIISIYCSIATRKSIPFFLRGNIFNAIDWNFHEKKLANKTFHFCFTARVRISESVLQ